MDAVASAHQPNPLTILDLPPELLIKIFCISHDSLDLIGPPSRFNLVSSPTSGKYDIALLPALAVSMVCSAWRTVALSIPSLWACIRVAHDDEPGYDPRHTLHVLHMYVSRSIHHPLTLYISMGFSCVEDGSPPGPDSYFYRILDCLCRESHRWYDVTLDLSTEYNSLDPDDTILSQLPLTTIRGKLPLLQKLSLIDAYMHREHVFDLFSTCPRLISHHSDTWVYPISQENIKNTELLGFFAGSDIGRVQGLISAYPKLEKLQTFALFEDLGNVPNPPVPVKHMGVKSLYAEQGIMYASVPLWNFVTFPNLQELDIWCCYERNGKFKLPSFPNFLE